MPERFSDVKKEAGKVMDDNKIMSSLADILLRANLITASEKVRMMQIIRQEGERDA